jgi:hypothetical protein
MLEALRQLYRRHGFLDTRLVIDHKEVPSTTTIHKHFGGLRQVYKLIGSKGPLGATYGLCDDELLIRLRRLLRNRGRLTEEIIDRSNGVPRSETYRRRFGSLPRAYRLAGYNAEAKSHQALLAKTRSLTDDQLLVALRKLLRERGYLTEKMIDGNGETPTSPTYWRRFGSLTRAYQLIGYRSKKPKQFLACAQAGTMKRHTKIDQLSEGEWVDGTTGTLTGDKAYGERNFCRKIVISRRRISGAPKSSGAK